MPGSDTPVKVKLRLKAEPRYWSVHTHSKYSATDALPTPAAIVAKAKELGYQGLGLTDHGNMAGSIELYTECMKAGIKPFPGSELYLVRDRAVKKGPEAKRYHCCMVAYTTEGYRNLVKISTETHKNFHFKPLLDLTDLARFHELGWSEGIALTTGCHFGLVIQTLINEGYDEAKNVVAAFASWFDTYVEVQNHDIHQEGHDEALISAGLLRIAEELDLPVLLTQDSHYVESADRPAHETLKRLVSWSDDLDDAVFPGDGFHLVDDAWMRRHHGDEVFERGAAGLDLLLSRHTLRIPEADDYQYRVPAVSTDPDRALRQRCIKRLAARGLLKPKYLDRLEEEVEVIEASGMGNYLLLVASVCDHMREQGIHFQTRGSAAGSLVCWMLGISNIDPLKWGARFDRFLSKDRTKPPDIDLDVENLRRMEVMDWIAERYSVSQICTWGTLGMSDDEETGKGSLKVKYFSKRRKQLQRAGQEVPQDEWETVPAEDKRQIYALAAKEALSGYGVHACALVLVNSRTELEQMVPMQWVASSKTMVTQYDGPTIESIGLIKLDLLGSKTMSVLRICCENMGVSPDALLDVPLNSPKVFSMISRGETDGFYQMEGYTTQRGCREVKPHRIGEVIDIMALYRPGVMNSGATASYVARKWKQEPLPERHEIIAKHTVKTRGILLYQDQIITILRELGMNPDDLTRFLKAVKASNKNTAKAKVEIDYYMPMVEQMCRARGMGDEDWDWMENAFRAFAEYSFNIAHATVYGITAYVCAWLAIFHPLEFHAALLAVAAGTDKEAKYLTVTRRRRVRVLPPDLNASKLVYAVDTRRKAIRKGLLSIEGIGMAMARDLVANQPYVDWADFTTKCIGTKVTGVKPFKPNVTVEDDLVGTVRHLHRANAFRDSLGATPLGRETAA